MWEAPIPSQQQSQKATNSRNLGFCDGRIITLRRRLSILGGFILLLGLSLACSAGGLLQRPADTPIPTRPLAPTYTATPIDGQILPQVEVTARTGTPGVIILSEGMDPRELLPTLFPTPIPSVTPTPVTTIIDGATPPGNEEAMDVEDGTLSAETATAEFTPTVTETPTPLPTETPVPTATDTPIPPTPYVVVQSGVVSLRSGPGVEYALVAQLGPLVPVAITGQNPEGSWYRLCCINRNEALGIDGSVWVASEHVRTMNDPSRVELIAPVESPPAPTPTGSLTPTPTITETPTETPVPFERVLGPQYFSSCNPYLIIWAKVFVGDLPHEVPLGGYYLEVLFGDDERSTAGGIMPSVEEFYRVRVPGTGYGDLTYNLSYEYRDPAPLTPTPCPPSNLPTGNWKAYVIDGEGTRLSDIVEFSTSPTNTYREVYVAWRRVR